MQLQRHSIQVAPDLVRHAAAPTASRCELCVPRGIIRRQPTVTIDEVDVMHGLVKVIEHGSGMLHLFLK